VSTFHSIQGAKGPLQGNKNLTRLTHLINNKKPIKCLKGVVNDLTIGKRKK